MVALAAPTVVVSLSALSEGSGSMAADTTRAVFDNTVPFGVAGSTVIVTKK